MNKRNQVRKSSSNSPAAPQSKTAQSKVKVHRETGLPLIALFPKGEEHGISDELVDLTKTEYALLKEAAAPTGDGILMFTIKAALDKAVFAIKDALTKEDEVDSRRSFTAQCEMENAIYHAAGCIYLLRSWIEHKFVEETGNPTDSTAAGIYYLSESACERLKSAFDLFVHSKQPNPGPRGVESRAQDESLKGGRK